ncbi:MAG TPA: AAA family ATPase [Dongiaceae bacterium]|nr:AAA family ATPase [Dongiaceae bacterium]
MMSSTPGQSDIVAFLSAPSAYPDAGNAVDVIATHASMIFLTGDHAYKLKRAVRYSYLDYSTVALRETACRAELELNRRTAPELYLDLVAVRRGADGTLSLGGSGDAVDWLVKMRRFPQEALFSHLAVHGRLTSSLATRAADRIAAFHAIAARTPARGGVAGIQAVIQINDENMRRTPPEDVATADIDRLRAASEAALARNADLLERRRAKGDVRRCHGDLHLGNICLIEDRPTLFDCIEFSDLIACIDVLYDLAFLLMDMRHRGLSGEAAILFNRYLDLTAQEDGLPALPLFLSLRAAVRAHVTATAAASQPAGAARDDKLRAARAYFDHAEDMLRPRPPRLVAIGGLSGTGKSHVAAGLSGALGIAPGARVLRSDVLRKRLAGVAPETRLPPSAYTPEANARVYAALAEAATAAIAAGYSVIIDAVAARPEERLAFARIAADAGIAFTGLWLEAPPEILLARIAARKDDASDADAGILRRQLTYDLGDLDWRRIDAGQAAEQVAAAARRALGLQSAL